ncbi:phosphoadenosine phosphosulfate reductase family protein [Rouxiella chamberiensis]|uniref:phosphoadenosine phosphosulfate reductase domain-containing protein n=1 Tax=Rouxiella chamberiensis TaxID=1513468 RepID=UPI0005D3223C|nr:phosphoadenosine phosphosulfate reductase family protein [Rouxiella chamberiensis]
MNAIDNRCFEWGTMNAILVSGGKDSLTQWLRAREAGVLYMTVFADTGHEHPLTLEYLSYLESKLGTVKRVRADFSLRIANKRKFISEKWPESLTAECGFTDKQAEKIIQTALATLYPTGIPFLDLCMWKGRFPSTKSKFCSIDLKQQPVSEQFVKPLLDRYEQVVTWQGVRAQESPQRANLAEWESGFDLGKGLSVYRPILNWTHEEVFAYAKRHGIKPNPLYEKGCNRVGCMPCVNVAKSEMGQIFKRWPDEIKRLAEWEKMVAACSRRGNAVFFHSGHDPKKATKNGAEVSLASHGIETYRDWALTTRGGNQFDLLMAVTDDSTCVSAYAGVCE